MSEKFIDISYWQGDLDFTKLKKAGINYIILRAGYKKTKDSKFDSYAKACQKNGIKIIGAYWFSYALNTAQAKEEAELCVDICKPYSIPTIFYDFEYDTVKKAAANGVALGSKECNDFTIAFCDTVKALGLNAGYYCNTDYYKNMYSDRVKNKGYIFWLAQYKSDYSYHEAPMTCDIFQYSSRAKVTGLNQNFDGNICYNTKLLQSSSATTTTKTNNSDSTKNDKLTVKEIIETLLNIAKNEEGYLEKASNSDLDSKTGNAGYNNYTKYWRDVYPSYQGQAWCACFVTWCFMKAFGKDMAKKLLKHYPYVYCPTLGELFTKNANPTVGDIVIFYRNGDFAHTGLVTKVSGDQFWTIEGNTSSLSGVVANGGGVFAKSYYNSNLPGTKFCTPDYSLVTLVNSVNNNSTGSTIKNYLEYGDNGSEVKSLQTKLNKLGYKLTVDGSFGNATKSAVLSFQKKYGLEQDGIAGKNTINKLNSVIESLNKSSSGNSTTSTTSRNTPSKTPKFVGKVNTSKLNVRTWAGTENTQLKSYPTLAKGNLIDVCDTVKASDNSSWYYIRIAGKYYGFVLAKYISKV